MGNASYNNFNYNHRPAKSIERKLFVELWKEIYGVTNTEKCSYVGMGSIFFSDFRLVHKELGLDNMINIEREKDDCERFKFNQPYSCITHKWGSSTEVLPEIRFKDKTIVWLDYDGSLQPYMFEDIDILFSKLNPGSFFTFTCNPSLSRFHDHETQSYIIDDFKEVFKGYHPFKLEKEMLEKKNAHYLIIEMINNRIEHNLKNRNASKKIEDHLVYLQLIFIKYKDGSPMFSTGGILISKKQIKEYKSLYLSSLSYTKGEGEDALELESPILTNKELNLLNSFLPSTKDELLSQQDLDFIPTEEKERYQKVYRYYPAFVEARNF